MPATLTIYARLVADYANQLVYSNIVPINVAPYYVELKNAPIETWWLIGADIADGSWGGDMGKCIIPMQPIEGEEYDKKTGQGKIRWIGYLAGNGFKLKKTTIASKWMPYGSNGVYNFIGSPYNSSGWIIFIIISLFSVLK